MISGIYCIENTINGKKYIGQTIDLEKRKYKHFWMLKSNNHSSIHLQSAFNKYGKENFIFKILIYCEPSELTKYEQFFVDFHTPELLYNIHLECVNSCLGISHKHTDETKKKISESNKGIQAGKNNPWYGKHLSYEHRKKISESEKGKIVSEETRRKLIQNHADVSGENHPQYGKKHSNETKKKMSEGHADFSGKNHPMYGKKHSEKAKRRMSSAHKGKTPWNKGISATEEAKRNMSQSAKERWRRKEENETLRQSEQCPQ